MATSIFTMQSHRPMTTRRATRDGYTVRLRDVLFHSDSPAELRDLADRIEETKETAGEWLGARVFRVGRQVGLSAGPFFHTFPDRDAARLVLLLRHAAGCLAVEQIPTGEVVQTSAGKAVAA